MFSDERMKSGDAFPHHSDRVVWQTARLVVGETEH